MSLYYVKYNGTAPTNKTERFLLDFIRIIDCAVVDEENIEWIFATLKARQAEFLKLNKRCSALNFSLARHEIPNDSYHMKIGAMYLNFSVINEDGIRRLKEQE